MPSLMDRSIEWSECDVQHNVDDTYLINGDRPGASLLVGVKSDQSTQKGVEPDLPGAVVWNQRTILACLG